MNTTLQQLSNDLADLVARLAPSVLAVPGRGGGASAVVWREQVAVTTAHQFRRVPARLTLLGDDGREHDATLAGADAGTDLAVYRVADAPPPVAPADAASVRTGALAVAIGRSARGGASASYGMVHLAAGPWQSWLGGALDRRLELDGGLHAGETGAAMADAAGAVFGIATPALSRRHAIVVPAATVSRVVDALLARGHVARAFLGIGAQPVEVDGSGGLLITALAASGPAAQAGLMVGDIVTAVGGAPAPSLAALRALLSDRVGASVALSLRRGGQPLELPVTVAEWPHEGRRCG